MRKISTAMVLAGLFLPNLLHAASPDLTRKVPNNQCYGRRGDTYTENVLQERDWTEKCDYRLFFFNDVDKVAEVPDAQCVAEITGLLNEQLSSLSGKDVMFVMGLADSRGRDKYNINLAQRRMNNVLDMLDQQQRTSKHASNNLEFFVAGESDDMAQYGGDGQTSNPRERAVCVIISRSGDRDPRQEGFTAITSSVSNKTEMTITISKGSAQKSEQRIKSIAANLQNMTANLGSSVWKNKEGNFNTSRLVSDSVAGVVLGTAGGLITSNIIKKNQVKGGFEDIKCTVGGQIVAEYGDDFSVGMR